MRACLTKVTTAHTITVTTHNTLYHGTVSDVVGKQRVWDRFLEEVENAFQQSRSLRYTGSEKTAA